MSVLVNSGGGQGIQSVKAGNMTCKCDISSCQCFHSKYEDVSSTQIKPAEGKSGLNSSVKQFTAESCFKTNIKDL